MQLHEYWRLPLMDSVLSAAYTKHFDLSGHTNKTAWFATCNEDLYSCLCIPHLSHMFHEGELASEKRTEGPNNALPLRYSRNHDVAFDEVVELGFGPVFEWRTPYFKLLFSGLCFRPRGGRPYEVVSYIVIRRCSLLMTAKTGQSSHFSSHYTTGVTRMSMLSWGGGPPPRPPPPPPRGGGGAAGRAGGGGGCGDM